MVFISDRRARSSPRSRSTRQLFARRRSAIASTVLPVAALAPLFQSIIVFTATTTARMIDGLRRYELVRRATFGPTLRRRSRMLSLDEIVGMAVLRQGLRMMMMLMVLVMRVGK